MNRLVDGQHDPLLAFRVRLGVAALPVKGVSDINRTKGSLGRDDISHESREARAPRARPQAAAERDRDVSAQRRAAIRARHGAKNVGKI